MNDAKAPRYRWMDPDVRAAWEQQDAAHIAEIAERLEREAGPSAPAPLGSPDSPNVSGPSPRDHEEVCWLNEDCMAGYRHQGACRFPSWGPADERSQQRLALLLHGEFCHNPDCPGGVKDYMDAAGRLLPLILTHVLAPGQTNS